MRRAPAHAEREKGLKSGGLRCFLLMDSICIGKMLVEYEKIGSISQWNLLIVFSESRFDKISVEKKVDAIRMRRWWIWSWLANAYPTSLSVLIKIHGSWLRAWWRREHAWCWTVRGKFLSSYRGKKFTSPWISKGVIKKIFPLIKQRKIGGL